MTFFDTSVFIASVLRSDKRHRDALARVAVATKRTSGTAAHVVTEVYSVLTRLPYPEGLTPLDALAVIDLIYTRFRIVSLNATEHLDVIRKSADAGLSGGIIHDAVILRCAQKAGADTLVTLNLRDFRRVRPQWAAHIVEP